jgi:hypothetical protein
MVNVTQTVQESVITLTQTDIIIYGAIILVVLVFGWWVLKTNPLQKIQDAKTKRLKEKSKPTSVHVKKPVTQKSVSVPKKMSPQAFTLLKKNGIYTKIEHQEQEKPNLLSPFGLWAWLFHAKKFKRRLYVIMHKENGYMEMFYAYYMGNLFEYQEGLYIVDEDRLRWNDSLKTFVAEFYEGISVPVQLQRFKTPTKKYLEETMADTQVEMNLNPQVLYQTVKTEMVQKVMKGEELEKFMNYIKKLLLFVLIGVIVTVIAIVGRFV